MRGVTILALATFLPIIVHAEPAPGQPSPGASAPPTADSVYVSPGAVAAKPLNIRVPTWDDPDKYPGNDTTAYGWRDGNTTTVLGVSPRSDADPTYYSQSIEGIRQDDVNGLFGLKVTLHQH